MSFGPLVVFSAVALGESFNPVLDLTGTSAAVNFAFCYSNAHFLRYFFNLFRADSLDIAGCSCFGGTGLSDLPLLGGYCNSTGSTGFEEHGSGCSHSS